MIRSIALTCGLAAAALPAQADYPVSLLDFGVLCDVTIEGRREAPLTESGSINLIDQGREMDVTTAQVPARIGLSFGIRLSADENTTLRDALVVVTHPPLGSGQITVQSWRTPVDAGEPSINLFTFEHEYELVQGLWRFQVLEADRLLVDQSFEVLGGYAVPAVQEICFGHEMTS